MSIIGNFYDAYLHLMAQSTIVVQTVCRSNSSYEQMEVRQACADRERACIDMHHFTTFDMSLHSPSNRQCILNESHQNPFLSQWSSMDNGYEAAFDLLCIMFFGRSISYWDAFASLCCIPNLNARLHLDAKISI